MKPAPYNATPEAEHEQPRRRSGRHRLPVRGAVRGVFDLPHQTGDRHPLPPVPRLPAPGGDAGAGDRQPPPPAGHYFFFGCTFFGSIFGSGWTSARSTISVCAPYFSVPTTFQTILPS